MKTFKNFFAALATAFGLTGQDAAADIKIVANGQESTLAEVLGSKEGMEAILADTAAHNEETVERIDGEIRALKTQITQIAEAYQAQKQELEARKSEVAAQQLQITELAKALGQKVVASPVIQPQNNGGEPLKTESKPDTSGALAGVSEGTKNALLERLRKLEAAQK